MDSCDTDNNQESILNVKNFLFLDIFLSLFLGPKTTFEVSIFMCCDIFLWLMRIPYKMWVFCCTGVLMISMQKKKWSRLQSLQGLLANCTYCIKSWVLKLEVWPIIYIYIYIYIYTYLSLWSLLVSVCVCVCVFWVRCKLLSLSNSQFSFPLTNFFILFCIIFF